MKGNMIERAAARVRSSHLERQRASKAYNTYMKDANIGDLKKDILFEQLRSDMQLAKENHKIAQQTYWAVKTCPPLSD